MENKISNPKYIGFRVYLEIPILTKLLDLSRCNGVIVVSAILKVTMLSPIITTPAIRQDNANSLLYLKLNPK